MESRELEDTRSVCDETVSCENSQSSAVKRQKTCIDDLSANSFETFASSATIEGSWQKVKYRGHASAKRLREEEIRKRRNIDTETKTSRNDMEIDSIDDEDSQDLCPDPYKHSDISDSAPPAPPVHKSCDANAEVSREPGVATNNVPDAQAAEKHVNTNANIIKEAYVVSGNILKFRDPSDNVATDTRKFNRYEDDYKGKAFIILRLPPDQTTTRRGKNQIKIWMILNELRICPISVTMISHFSAEAEFKDFRDANYALDKIDALGAPVKLRANLEQRFCISKGVISDWPSSIPELWSCIRDKSKILSIERMYRRKWDPENSKTTLVATDSIIVTFKDKNIRDLTVFDNGIALRVRRYVPQVRQCFNCFRFGHTKLSCKSDTRCIICGDKAHGRCEREQRCYNCGGQHKSTFRGCPQYDKNKNINIVMAHRNVSFYSARQIVEGETTDSSQEFQNKFTNPTSWPSLPHSSGPNSYSEVLRSVPRSSRTSGLAAPIRRDNGNSLPPLSTRDKRSTIYEAPRKNFYKSFDLRSGEITREKRGIMFSASRCGESEVLSRDNFVNVDHQEDQRITETIESILLLLRRVPGARIKLIRALAMSGSQEDQEGDAPQYSDNLQLYEETENRESSRTIQSRNILGSGGVSISVRSCIAFDVLPIVGTPPTMYDTVGIKTSNLENNINIVAVYRHPRAGMSARDLTTVFNTINGNPCDSIILGDFNAHNTAWNCESSNNNGDILHDAMANAGFICINVDTRSRIGYSGQRDSNIDLLFAAGSVAGSIDYQQLDESHDSDHVPIGFFVDINTRIYRKLSNRTSTKRTDWSKYRVIVEREIDRTLAPAGPRFEDYFEKYYQDFISTLKSAVFQASGRRMDMNRPCQIDPRKVKRSHRWWNLDCDVAIRDRRRAFSEFKRLRNIHAWTEYKRQCAVTRKVLNKAKKDNFDDFCKGINRFTSLSYVWSTMRILKNTRKNIEWNKWQTKDREVEIRNTIDGLAPPFVGFCPTGEPGHLSIEGEFDAPFIRPELDRAFRMIRKDSAPGMDGVEYQMLRLLPESGWQGESATHIVVIMCG
ncbi:uncharacterized protein LOC143903991 isoform X1 [Temnothorax americanus]|uniref:uncharacterized protein LOC143903991 isoform X1 n=1 Tax=Temnothorax americanus TaxID=1964332 RepID=UPI0040683BFE